MKKVFFGFLVLYIIAVLCFAAGLFFYSPFSAVATALFQRETFFALSLSFQSAFIATIIASVVALPVAYALAKYDFPLKSLVEAVIDIPIILPPLVIGLGLLILFGNKLSFLNIVFTRTAIVIAQFFVISPIIMNSLKAVFLRMPEQYEKVGMMLGLNRWGVFFRITLPILAPSLGSGILLGFSRALGEFGATLMLAGATRFRTETMPIAIYLNMSSGDFEIALAIAVMYLALAVAIFVTLRVLWRKPKWSI